MLLFNRLSIAMVEGARAIRARCHGHGKVGEHVVEGVSRRGPASSSETVQVYKILVEAGEPLTVPQIVQRFPPGFESAAMNAYRKHKEETDPTWLEGKESGRWGAEAQAEAMVWWVRKIIRTAIINKVINSMMEGAHSRNTIVRESTYVPGKPPNVRRTVWVQVSRTVPWTLEDDQELNRGKSAELEFLATVDDWRRKPKPRAADARALLDLAERVIRAR